jgi:small subunit ribosomal protein S21
MTSVAFLHDTPYRVRAMAVSVKLAFPGEHIDSLLRRFKKACAKNDIGHDARRHEAFIRPGERRRQKSLVARRRQQKREGMKG